RAPAAPAHAMATRVASRTGNVLCFFMSSSLGWRAIPIANPGMARSATHHLAKGMSSNPFQLLPFVAVPGHTKEKRPPEWTAVRPCAADLLRHTGRFARVHAQVQHLLGDAVDSADCAGAQHPSVASERVPHAPDVASPPSRSK